MPAPHDRGITSQRQFEIAKGRAMADIQCVRCGESGPQLEKAPLRNDLGEKVFASICQRCWDLWLKYQTSLINHYGLDVREKPAREFLMSNMEAFLFKQGDAEEIDVSKKGSVSW
jgi:Fe-S cluster biosynthesis and repair protein YggX